MKEFPKRPGLINKVTNYDAKRQLWGKLGLPMGLTVLALGDLVYQMYGV